MATDFVELEVKLKYMVFLYTFTVDKSSFKESGALHYHTFTASSATLSPW